MKSYKNLLFSNKPGLDELHKNNKKTKKNVILTVDGRIRRSRRTTSSCWAMEKESSKIAIRDERLETVIRRTKFEK